MEVDVIAEDNEQDILSSDNQPTPETLSKYRLAGHLCTDAIKAVIAKCLPGTSCTTLCQLGDDTILTQVDNPNPQPPPFPLLISQDLKSVPISRERNC